MPPCLLMRRDLAGPIEPAAWPVGIRPDRFTPADAADVHRLLADAYRDGGGSVPPFATWWPALSSDSEFAADLVFLARDADGRLVAVAQCWTSAFIKDFAVDRSWRRRGIGRALLLHTFDAFRQRGAAAVSLKVETDNPTGAIRFYESVGMRRA